MNDLERLSQPIKGVGGLQYIQYAELLESNSSQFFPRCLCGHISLALPSTPNILTVTSKDWILVCHYHLYVLTWSGLFTNLRTLQGQRNKLQSIRRKTELLEWLCAFKGTWGLELPVVLKAVWRRAEAQWRFEPNANLHANIVTVTILICWICDEIRLNIQAAIKMFFWTMRPLTCYWGHRKSHYLTTVS